jgi:multidrug efflux pump
LHAWIQRRFDALTRGYRVLLERSVQRFWLFAVLMLAAVVSSVVLFRIVPSELAPPEDRGVFFASMVGP